MAEYGMVYDVNDIKRQLTESNRDYYNKQTWQNMMQSTNVGAAAAQSSLQQQYSSATSQAYSSYLASETALKNSGIVGSGISSVQQQNKDYLQEAFNTYSGKLSSGTSAIEEQRVKTQTAIDEMLTQQATNIKDYAESMPLYLNYLYETDPALFESKQWSKYMTSDFNQTDSERLKSLEGIKKKSKEEQQEYNALVSKRDETRLMTKEELFASRQNEEGEETGLYDSEGNLTLKGLDFFDQIMNSPDLFDRSFGKFMSDTDVDWLMEHNEGMTRTEAKQLAERNAELQEWSKSANPFNYTVDEYGQSTNKGSFKEMIGLASDDIKYSFIERFGGYTKTEIDDMYSGFYKVVEDMKGVDLGKHGKGQVQNLKAATTEVFSLFKDLGIDETMKQAGFDERTMTSLLDQAISAMKSNKQMDQEWWSTTLGSTLAGAGTGAVYGAITGAPANALPVLGQMAHATYMLITTTIGAIAGLITGITGASAARKQQKAINKSLAKDMKSGYLDMLSELTKYSQEIRSQAERQYYFG